MADTPAPAPAPAPAPTPDQIYWANMGAVASFKDGEWSLTPYPTEFGHKKAFVKVSGGTTVSALSPKCPHQGCVVAFNSKADQFDCPCHAGVFSDTGAYISGPGNAPLVTLQSKIDSGNVMVQCLTPPKPAS